MVFKVKNPDDGKFYTFRLPRRLWLQRPRAGQLPPMAGVRLAWQFGFSYLQCDGRYNDYVSPQHTNQFPIAEVYQALKAYNRDPKNASKPLTMMDAMRWRVYDSPEINGVKITTEFANQLEERRSVVSYKATDAAPPGNRTSLETSGPFKPGPRRTDSTRSRQNCWTAARSSRASWERRTRTR